MNKHFEKIKLVKVLRIATSSCLAILVASLLKLEYSSSAGIIALLITQDTKKDTIKDIIKRCLSYFLAVALSFCVFHIFGYNTLAFGLFMFLMVGISYYIKWDSVLSSSVVVSTHFLFEGHHSIQLIINELLLLFIGVGITMVLNLFVANNTKEIKKDIENIENEFALTFMEMSNYVLHIDASKYDREQLTRLKDHLDNSMMRAIRHQNNEFFSDSSYYIRYMEARIQQSDTMLRIIDNMHHLTSIPFNANEISHFMTQIGLTIHQKNNTLGLRSEYTALNEQFDNFPIPTTRTEFENLATIHDILIELGYYLQAKSDFVDSLSEKQVKRYWAEGGLFS